jgi:hypothetical protein
MVEMKPQHGDIRLVAQRSSDRNYIIVENDDDGKKDVMQFLMGIGGNLYSFNYVTDKNGDVIPKCNKLAEVNADGSTN